MVGVEVGASVSSDIPEQVKIILAGRCDSLRYEKRILLLYKSVYLLGQEVFIGPLCFLLSHEIIYVEPARNTCVIFVH